jgi:hypothetical protein
VIKGECKPKETAKAEFDEAIAKGDNAGLAQWVADDSKQPRHSNSIHSGSSSMSVFRISIGSIPARETVVVKLVVCLCFDATQLRSQLRSMF